MSRYWFGRVESQGVSPRWAEHVGTVDRGRSRKRFADPVAIRRTPYTARRDAMMQIRPCD
ncbi:hypothetical protein CLG96_02605 [Sphingomonas oleivorans]|uniref:Uncharacterized protein n=1 Tax=Sphingomonas oleivorans TaxID=1735121 RepID=A0A2T5G1K9_9SPHN|nr:hypothetical protein CLG96_02605 [Sphingomonas oleivorans]